MDSDDGLHICDRVGNKVEQGRTGDNHATVRRCNNANTERNLNPPPNTVYHGLVSPYSCTTVASCSLLPSRPFCSCLCLCMKVRYSRVFDCKFDILVCLAPVGVAARLEDPR